MSNFIIVYERDTPIDEFSWREYILQVGDLFFPLNLRGDKDPSYPDIGPSYKPIFYCRLDDSITLCNFIRSFIAFRSFEQDLQDHLISLVADMYNNEKDEDKKALIDCYGLF